jgi:hypothetical protein
MAVIFGVKKEFPFILFLDLFALCGGATRRNDLIRRTEGENEWHTEDRVRSRGTHRSG